MFSACLRYFAQTIYYVSNYANLLEAQISQQSIKALKSLSFTLQISIRNFQLGYIFNTGSTVSYINEALFRNQKKAHWYCQTELVI